MKEKFKCTNRLSIRKVENGFVVVPDEDGYIDADMMVATKAVDLAELVHDWAEEKRLELTDDTPRLPYCDECGADMGPNGKGHVITCSKANSARFPHGRKAGELA